MPEQDMSSACAADAAGDEHVCRAGATPFSSQVRAYGTWPSPISASDLATIGARPGDLVADGDRILWTWTDPDCGAMRLFDWTPEHGTRSLASDLDVRSRVHEYGGGAVMVGHGRVVVVDFADQDLHVVHDDGTAIVVANQGVHVRWAAGAFVDADRLVAVRETHDPDDDVAVKVVNELVLTDLSSGDQHVLVTGHDFVGDPALGPDGRVAWTTWEHPAMPWDEGTLWAGRIDGTQLVDVVVVADHDGVALADWTWQGNDLVFSDDRSGTWEVHRATWINGEFATPPVVSTLTAADIDLGGPRWTHGRHWLAVVGDSNTATLVAIGVDRADARLGGIDADGWTARTGDETVVVSVVAAGDAVATIEVDMDGRLAVRRRAVANLASDAITIHASEPLTTRTGDLGGVRAVEAEVDDDMVHAFLHLPANADVDAPDDDRPPLLMFLHGGPTSNVFPVRSNMIAYWTTRGFAVVDLNYRGSAGYGRAYRELLKGNWGVTDVADCIAMARSLAADGLVDGGRMAIRGGSAGGFTTLAVLTQPDHPFVCGTSFAGIADLAAMAAHTHKFESRYLDGLIGRLPEDVDIYAQRSPLSHLDNLAVPVLVLQGTEDKVVPLEQAQAVVNAAAARGIPHVFIAFDGEGHGFRKPSSIARWHETELAFYGEVMGFEPAGDLPHVFDDQDD